MLLGWMQGRKERGVKDDANLAGGNLIKEVLFTGRESCVRRIKSLIIDILTWGCLLAIQMKMSSS